MIHNLEDKSRKELLEICRIQQEEHAGIMQLLQTAERERDGFKEKCEMIEFYNGDVKAAIDEFMPKFAIENQIKGAKAAADVLIMSNESQERQWFDSVFINQLRQQLRKDQDDEK